eukprot:1223202-Rhodomonas_salina.3
MRSRIRSAGQRLGMLSSSSRRSKPRGAQFGAENTPPMQPRSISPPLQPRPNQMGGAEVEVLPILRYHSMCSTSSEFRCLCAGAVVALSPVDLCGDTESLYVEQRKTT